MRWERAPALPTPSRLWFAWGSGHVLKNVGEVVLRVVGRTHATLKQRQIASGVQVRLHYNKLPEPKPTGPVEGQINRLRFIKRSL